VPYADLADVRLYYERAGTGSRLLVVNGSGSDLRRQPNAFSWPVASRFDVLTYDHRGLGRSDPAEAERQPTMVDFAADALGLVDDAGWDRFAVIGVSFGGMVAQELAILAGARIDRLVLACTSSGGAGGASYPLHELSALPLEQRAEHMVGIMDTRAAHDEKLRAALLSWMRQAGDGVAGAGFERQLAARSRHDTSARLGAIVAPTLVAAGRYDGIAPVPNSEALAKGIPGARLAVFEGGHAFFVQDPTAWPTMIGFLDS